MPNLKKLSKAQIAAIRTELRVTKTNAIHAAVGTPDKIQAGLNKMLSKEKIHFQHWTGSNKNKSLSTDGPTVRWVKICEILGYTFERGNDAPRGGADGDYFIKKGNRTTIDFLAIWQQCSAPVVTKPKPKKAATKPLNIDFKIKNAPNCDYYF
jgi:hypothetical protein